MELNSFLYTDNVVVSHIGYYGRSFFMKKFTVIGLLAVLTTFLLAGCGMKEEDMKYLKDFDPSKYVTLGDYKNMNITIKKNEVTDEDVDSYINYLLAANESYVDITDRDVAQNGDVANIDYVGKKDGVAFDGGTATGFDLDLGSGVFIDGFEDGVVGMKVGETKELNLTFPETYSNEELAGADVVFTVTLNAIKEAVIPELTDEYVKSLDNGLATVEEYKADIRKTMEDSYASSRESEIEQAITDKLLEEATINGAPSGFVTRLTDTVVKEITETANNAGVEPGLVAAYYYGVSEDNYVEGLKTFVNDNLLPNYLVFGAVASAEGIKVTDQDIDDDIQRMIDENAATITVEEYKKDFTEDDLESYREYLLITKAMDMLKQSVTVTEE